MLGIQLVLQKTKTFFRAVIFLKDNGIDADADISATFILPKNKEIIFLPGRAGAQNYVYPESTSRFVHRIEKGIYIVHSRNKAVFFPKKIIVNALFKGKRFEKEFLIQ